MFRTLAAFLLLAAMCPLLRAQSDVAPAQTDKDSVPQQPEKIMHVGGSVKPPTAILEPKPQAETNVTPSKTGRRPKFEGAVVVSLIVEKDGKPSHIRVVRSVRTDLDAKAIEAVSQYKFNPATKNGTPVAVDLLIEVHFQLF